MLDEQRATYFSPMSENGTDKRLFLLDAYALIYRAYFSFIRTPRINSKRLNTSAAFGFTTTLLDLIKREKPTHLAVVFDMGADAREAEHAEYKANRQEMPDDIRSNVPYIRRIIEAFNIPVIESEGYEADDVIGTLAKKAEKEGYTTYMVTPDKDFGQLVSEKIKIYKPGKAGGGPEVMGVKEVCDRWGGLTSPEQVKDILGLMGDAVDNIPGIPGIGEKTAMKLVQQFGSLETVIEKADDLKGKLQENVKAHAKDGIMSKRLATIMTDAPVDLDHDALHLDPPDRNKVNEVFSELEFRTLAKQVLGEEAGQLQTTAAPADLFGQPPEVDGDAPARLIDLNTIDTVAHTYHLVAASEGMYMLAAQLKKQKAFCFDTETTGLDEHTADLVGMAFSWKEHTGHYVAVPADRKEAQKVVDIFKPLLEDPDKEKVAQNLKYDMKVMRRYGVEVRGPVFDTMVAHYLIQPELKHNMDYLAETHLKYRPVSIETLIGPKNKPLRTMREADVEAVKEYSAEDADVTWQLKELFAPRLRMDGLKELFDEVEMPLVAVLADMEWEGIALDVKALESFSRELQADLVKLDERITEMAGVRFNIDSPRQLGEILFDRLKISPDAKKTRTGQYTTSEDVLSALAHAHPIVPAILDYRSLKKLKGTYVDALPREVNPATGRVHTNFRQAVAATGRLASDEPNLQNIPIRTERGREIRKAFVPRDKHHKLLSADYSQIELRVIAHMSGDTNLREAFHRGLDIHAATAAKVFNVDIAAVTREQRGRAKAVNFGLAYGQGAFGLSQNLGIPRAEAKQIIDDYFAQFPGVRSYMDEQINFCRKHGYVKTLMDRRRYLPDITSANQTVRAQAERIAINAPMQGTAADIIKVAMVRIHERIRKEKLKSRMLLTVHDELVFDVHEKEEEVMQALVKELMEGAMKLDVPLVVDMHLGKNWLEAH